MAFLDLFDGGRLLLVVVVQGRLHGDLEASEHGLGLLGRDLAGLEHVFDGFVAFLERFEPVVVGDGLDLGDREFDGVCELQVHGHRSLLRDLAVGDGPLEGVGQRLEHLHLRTCDDLRTWWIGRPGPGEGHREAEGKYGGPSGETSPCRSASTLEASGVGQQTGDAAHEWISLAREWGEQSCVHTGVPQRLDSKQGLRKAAGGLAVGGCVVVAGQLALDDDDSAEVPGDGVEEEQIDGDPLQQIEQRIVTADVGQLVQQHHLELSPRDRREGRRRNQDHRSEPAHDHRHVDDPACEQANPAPDAGLSGEHFESRLPVRGRREGSCAKAAGPQRLDEGPRGEHQ